MKKTAMILILLAVMGACLSGCTKPRPHNVRDVCSIFRQYPTWYWATLKTHQRWGVPIWVQMAIMYQESRFNAKIKPPRTKLLWIIPWTRPTSAYGYTQALNSTWNNYRRATGNTHAKRSSFASASDFIGWYSNMIRRRTGISLYNANALYLAYHEGPGGYLRKTYLRKPWLVKVARGVKYRANIYRRQYASCKSSLPQPTLWNKLMLWL